MCTGDIWSFESFFLHDYTILYCVSSNSRLYTSIFGSSSRRTTSPCSLRTRCGFGGGKDCGAIIDALGMRSMSWPSSYCSISMFCCIKQLLNLLNKFLNLNLASYSSSTGCSIVSTYLYTIFSISVPCPSPCSCFFLSSLSLILSSYFAFNFFSISYSLLYFSSNLCFSLLFYSTLLSQCCLFTSISKANLSTSGHSLNL